MILLGIVVLYATIHMLVLLFKKGWCSMTTYERIVAIVGTVFVGCVYLSVMFPSN